MIWSEFIVSEYAYIYDYENEFYNPFLLDDNRIYGPNGPPITYEGIVVRPTDTILNTLYE